MHHSMIDDGRLDIIKNRFHCQRKAQQRLVMKYSSTTPKLSLHVEQQALDPHHGTRVPEGWKTPSAYRFRFPELLEKAARV